MDEMEQNKENESHHWPDNIRLEMIEKSERYENPNIYQYGYYDGYQKAISELRHKPFSNK